MRWALYAIAALNALGGLFTITSVGKPRKPITPGVAAFVIVFDAAIVTLLVIAAGDLP